LHVQGCRGAREVGKRLVDHASARPDEISVSVIVPAFNMELYIEECLRSLFEQTVDGLEIIVVDDGSTDRTRDVVESLRPPGGKSLRLISKPNGGLSSARNAGMAAAQGRWIGFVDADDWVASSMYSLLLSEAESAGAEVAIARNVRVDQASGAQMPATEIERWNEFVASPGRFVNPRRSPDLFLLDHSPCKRAYRRTFLENMGFRFAEGLVFEDLISSFQILCEANSVVLIDEALYFYRVGRPGQIISRSDDLILDIVPALGLIMDELWNHSANDELWANFICFQGRMVLYLTSEIMDAHREKLVEGCAKIARMFPPGGLRRFRDKFRSDASISTAVELQLHGNPALYAEFAQTKAVSKRVEKVVNSDVLRSFFVARAQVTSRLARISSRRRWRRTQDNPMMSDRSASASVITRSR
jgi:glycosyltransferase involved in cell wall biosynthesis